MKRERITPYPGMTEGSTFWLSGIEKAYLSLSRRNSRVRVSSTPLKSRNASALVGFLAFHFGGRVLSSYLNTKTYHYLSKLISNQEKCMGDKGGKKDKQKSDKQKKSKDSQKEQKKKDKQQKSIS